MSPLLRGAIGLCAAALLLWVAVGIYRAGSDVPPPSPQLETKLTAGHAEGRRVDGKPSWSLDYDRVIATPDTTIATLENVRHGQLYRRGKPFMRMKADHVVINTLSNDFIVTGPLELIQDDKQHHRTLVSDAANYSGILQTLTLMHPADIVSDGAKLKVANVTVDFRSGDMKLGPIVGLFR